MIYLPACYLLEGARCPASQSGERGTLAFSYGVAPSLAAPPVAHNVPVSSALGHIAARGSQCGVIARKGWGPLMGSLSCNLLVETASCTTTSHARGAPLCLQLTPPCLTGLGWTAGTYQEGLLYLRRGATLGGLPAWGLLLILNLTLPDAEVKTMMVRPPLAPGRAHNSRSGPSVLDPGSLLLPLHTTQGTATRLV